MNLAPMPHHLELRMTSFQYLTTAFSFVIFLLFCHYVKENIDTKINVKSCTCVVVYVLSWGGPQMYKFEQVRSGHMGTPQNSQTDRHNWKLYFPSTFLRAVKTMIFVFEVQWFSKLIAWESR